MYLQYEHLLVSHENFMGTLHDFPCMLLSVIVQDVELTIQDVETKGTPVVIKEFFY